MKKYFIAILMVYAVAGCVKTARAQNPGRSAKQFDRFLTMTGFTFWGWSNPNGSLSTSGPNPYFDFYTYDTILALTCERRYLQDKPNGGVNPDRVKSGSSATQLPYLWYHPAAGTGYFLRTAIAERFEAERHLINLNSSLQYQGNDTIQFDGFMAHNGTSGRSTLRGRNAHDADASSPAYARQSPLYGTDSTANCLVLDSLGHPGVFDDSLWSQGFWSTNCNYPAPHWHRTDDFGHRSIGLRFRVRIDDTNYHHTSDTVFALHLVIYDTASIATDTTLVAYSNDSGFIHSPTYFDTVTFRFLRPWTVTKTYVTLSWPATHKITVDWMEALTTRINTSAYKDSSIFPDGNTLSLYLGIENPDSMHYNELLSYETLTANQDTVLKVWIDSLIHRYKGYCQFVETREEPPLASMTTLKRAIKLMRDRSDSTMEIVCSMHDSLDANTGFGSPTRIGYYGNGFYGLGLPDAVSYYLEGVRLGWLDSNYYADPKYFWTGYGIHGYRNCMPKRTIQEGDALYKWEALYANTGFDATHSRYDYTRDSVGRPDEPGLFYDRDRYLSHIDFRSREGLTSLRLWKRMCDRNAAIGQRFFVNMEFDSPVAEDTFVHRASGGGTRLATAGEMRQFANLCTSAGASGLYWWNYASDFGPLGQHPDYDSNWRWVKIGSHDSARWFDAHKEHVEVIKSIMPSIQRYGDTLLRSKFVGDWTAQEALFVATAPFQDSIHSLNDSGKIDRLDTARDTIRIHRFANTIDTNFHVTYANVWDSSAVNRTLVHVSEWIDTMGGVSDTLLYITNMRTDDSYVADSTTHPGTIDSVLGTFDRRYITMKMKAAHLVTDVADTAHLRIMGKVRTPYVGEGDSLVVWLLPGEGVLVRLTAPPDSMKQMRIAINYPKAQPSGPTQEKLDHGLVKFSDYVIGVNPSDSTLPSSPYSYVGIKDWQAPTLHQDSLLYQKFSADRPEMWRHQEWSDVVGPVFKFKKTLPVVTLSGRRDGQTGLDSIAHPITITTELENHTEVSGKIRLYDPFFVHETSLLNSTDTTDRATPFKPQNGVVGPLFGADSQHTGGVFLGQNPDNNPLIPKYALTAYLTRIDSSNTWTDGDADFTDYSFVGWQRRDTNNRVHAMMSEQTIPVIFNSDTEKYTAVYRQKNLVLGSPTRTDTGYGYNNQRKLWFLRRDSLDRAWYRNVFSSYGRIYTALGWHQGGPGPYNGWMHWQREQLLTDWQDTTACFPAMAMHVDTSGFDTYTTASDTVFSYVYQGGGDDPIDQKIYRATVADDGIYRDSMWAPYDSLQTEATPVVAPVDIYDSNGVAVGQWDVVAYGTNTWSHHHAIAVRVIARFHEGVDTWVSDPIYLGSPMARYPTIWAADTSYYTPEYHGIPVHIPAKWKVPVYIAWQDTSIRPLGAGPMIPPQMVWDIYCRPLTFVYQPGATDSVRFDTTVTATNVSSPFPGSDFYDNKRPCISGIRRGVDTTTGIDSLSVVIAYETTNQIMPIGEGQGVVVAELGVDVPQWSQDYFFLGHDDPFTDTTHTDTISLYKPSVSLTRYTFDGSAWTPTNLYYSLSCEARRRHNNDVDLWHFAINHSRVRHDTVYWYRGLRDPQISVLVQGHDSDVERMSISSGSTPRWLVHQNYGLFKASINHNTLYDYRAVSQYDTTSGLQLTHGMGEIQLDDGLNTSWLDLAVRSTDVRLDSLHSSSYFLQTDEFNMPASGTLTYSPWASEGYDSLFSLSHERVNFTLDFFDSTDAFVFSLDTIFICDTAPHVSIQSRSVQVNQPGPVLGHLKFVRQSGGIVTDGRIHEIISPKILAAMKRSGGSRLEQNGDGVDLIALENPLKSFTDIGFEIPAAGPVQLTVSDGLGRPVADLVSGRQFHEGEHTIRWKPDSKLPSGIYTVLLRFAGMTKSLQVSYVK